MKCGVLFSGGKDSSLAALLLSRDYEVELNTFVFDHGRDLAAIRRAADYLGLPLEIRYFRPGFIDEVISVVLEDGFPNRGINLVHRVALQELSTGFKVVGDGTRFDDRVPLLSRAEVQAFTDRTGCSYVRPLLGFGRREIDRLVRHHLAVAYGRTGEISNGDYEQELRAAIRQRGIDPISIFPSGHQQSLVIGRAHA
jgi:predicted subunit of tRNA(5-methylaminomethyl-2-thiouridylate) methyltransferase